ncbi:hypothetical protein GIB67_003439 [Kingdonia uniflora]|uniref:Uncharacterized protein n=1 Tax=Kingdonia uniflora TaxID=39325 RepID=A0A7J7P916_9MAGN|nr:hypothetical protein GIB67_003439 [Kingdonia uniflora]
MFSRSESLKKGIIEGSSSCNKANKNGRGYAKPWSEWDNEKIKILKWNEDCQPLGPNEPKLMSHLAMFPLTMLSWKVASNTSLDGVWQSVKDNINAPDGFKEVCFQKMAFSWKAFKYKIKLQHYKKYNTDEKRLASIPPETIRRRLLELPEEKRETNIEARDNIFKDVIGEDGHRRVLYKGVVARPKNVRSRTSSLSFQNYEDELAKLQREAGD